MPGFLIRFNPARPAVDARGVFTKEVSDVLTRLIASYDASSGTLAIDVAALEAAPVIVSSATGAFSDEDVVTDTATIAWDFGTAGQAKASVIDGSIGTAKLGGDITAAGKALLDDANAAAQLVTLGAMPASTTLDAVPVAVASVNFNGQQATSFRIENRTSDPASPAVGQLWLRTDL